MFGHKFKARLGYGVKPCLIKMTGNLSSRQEYRGKGPRPRAHCAVPREPC